jgi:hypothetical protein
MGNIIHGIQGFLRDREIHNHGREWLEPIADITPTTATRTNNNNNGFDDSQIHWKSLPYWMDHFEPPYEEEEHRKNGTTESETGPSQHHDSNGIGRVKTAVRTKAGKALYRTMERRMTKRTLRLLCDVTSRILTEAEDLTANNNNNKSEREREEKEEVENDGNNDNDTPSVPMKTTSNCLVNRLLNNINGILLTYRFRRDEKGYRMDFIRRKATDQLTETLWECLPSQDTADNLLALQRRLRQRLISIEENVCRNFIITHLDDLLEHVHHINDRIDDKIESRFGDEKISLSFVERLAQIDRVAEGARVQIDNVSTVIVSTENVIDKAIVVGAQVATMATTTTMTTTRPVEHHSNSGGGADDLACLVPDSKSNTSDSMNAAQELVVENATLLHEQAVLAERTLLQTKKAALAKKSEVVIRIVEAVKSYVLSEMDSWTDRIVTMLDHVLLEFYEILVVARETLNTVETKGRIQLKELQRKMYDRVENLALEIDTHVKAEVDLITRTIGAFMVHPPDAEDHHHGCNDDDYDKEEDEIVEDEKAAAAAVDAAETWLVESELLVEASKKLSR